MNLTAEIRQGNLGSDIHTGVVAYRSNVLSTGVQPVFFTTRNPVVDDSVLNSGIRSFDVAISGTVNGAVFSDLVTVTVQDDEVGKTPTVLPELRGTEGRDVNLGTPAAESIFALGGNDSIRATAGDRVDGGTGLDTVTLSGFSWLSPRATSNGWTVSNGTGGQVTLVNVERLETSTSLFALDVDGVAGVVYRIYQAAFARKPDQGGITFWINEMDKGMTLIDVATGFAGSQEFKKSTVATLRTRNLLTASIRTFSAAKRRRRA